MDKLTTDVIQTAINFFAMGGTLLAAIVATKALRTQIPLISLVVGKTNKEQEQESKGYRIDIEIENVGYCPANVMVIDATSPEINKADIGVPTIIDKSKKSNISIWLKDKEKPVKVAVALYYFDIQHSRCYRTVSHLMLKYSDETPEDVFRMEFQKASRIRKKRIFNFGRKRYKKVPDHILQWAGERKTKEEYFTEDWLVHARKFVSSEISPIAYYKSPNK